MSISRITLLHAFKLLVFISNTIQQSTFIPPTPPPLNLTFGIASLTHYDLPLNYLASCGCVAKSTHYPTAAINALAFGSNIAYGHSCGQCYKLTLQSTPYSPLPPIGDGLQFDVNDSKTPFVIVKIIDSCPKGGPWCAQSWDPIKQILTKNQLGMEIHFDLAWPSIAISKSFFPLDSTKSDYGVWTAQYELVDCEQWEAGYNDANAWGSDWAQQDSACCPMRPFYDSTAFPTQPNIQLPLSLNISAQMEICPSYEGIHNGKTDSIQSSLAVPNTSNILSRRNDIGKTNSAISAHSSLSAVQAFRNALYFGRSPQPKSQKNQFFFPTVTSLNLTNP